MARVLAVLHAGEEQQYWGGDSCEGCGLEV